MRRFALALAACSALAAPAFAADMPTKAPAYYAPTWTGFYLGGNVGYGWMTDNTSIDGVLGGGQLGYNLQMGQVVLGVEGDIQAASIKGSGTFTNGLGSSISETMKANWFGTIRGRVGYAMGSWMPYVTGGVAFVGIKHDGVGVTGVAGTYSGSNSLTGWTIGGGAEWMFAPKWSAKLEYLHIELPSHTNTYTTTAPAIAVSYGKIKSDLVRLGINYHF